MQHESQIKKRLMGKAAKTRTPLSGVFELTPRCNMNCKMCYIRMTDAEMKSIGRERTAEEWIDFGKSCAEAGMVFLLLTGGEPFVRKDFKEIYKGLKKLGLIISINSNGTLIDDETVEWLAEDPPRIMNITLYGASSDTYNRLCGNGNGFDRLKDTVNKLSAKGIDIQINVSLTNDNISDLDEIVEFGKSRKIPMKITSYMFNPVRKADMNSSMIDTVRFTEKECAMARFNATKAQLEPEHFELLRNQYRNGMFSAESENDDCGINQEMNMSCAAGRCSFWVTWDGRLLPCGMMNTPAAKVFEKGFEKSWQEIVESVNQIVLPDECNRCKLKNVCRPCGAMVSSESGCFNKKPQYLCNSTMEFVRLMKGTDEEL